MLRSETRVQSLRVVTILPLVAGLVLLACSDDETTGPGDQHESPTASIAASPMSVPAGDGDQTVVTLDGSGSSDPDGDQLSYAWTVPSGTFVEGTTASDAIAKVTFPGAAPYVVTLVVDDGNGGSDEAQVTIGIF
jgi:hypothetical protein